MIKQNLRCTYSATLNFAILQTFDSFIVRLLDHIPNRREPINSRQTLILISCFVIPFWVLMDESSDGAIFRRRLHQEDLKLSGVRSRLIPFKNLNHVVESSLLEHDSQIYIWQVGWIVRRNRNAHHHRDHHFCAAISKRIIDHGQEQVMISGGAIVTC